MILGCEKSALQVQFVQCHRKKEITTAHFWHARKPKKIYSWCKLDSFILFVLLSPRMLLRQSLAML